MCTKEELPRINLCTSERVSVRVCGWAWACLLPFHLFFSFIQYESHSIYPEEMIALKEIQTPNLCITFGSENDSIKWFRRTLFYANDEMISSSLFILIFSSIHFRWFLFAFSLSHCNHESCLYCRLRFLFLCQFSISLKRFFFHVILLFPANQLRSGHCKRQASDLSIAAANKLHLTHSSRSDGWFLFSLFIHIFYCSWASPASWCEIREYWTAMKIRAMQFCRQWICAWIFASVGKWETLQSKVDTKENEKESSISLFYRIKIKRHLICNHINWSQRKWEMVKRL